MKTPHLLRQRGAGLQAPLHYFVNGKPTPAALDPLLPASLPPHCTACLYQPSSCTACPPPAVLPAVPQGPRQRQGQGQDDVCLHQGLLQEPPGWAEPGVPGQRAGGHQRAGGCWACACFVPGVCVVCMWGGLEVGEGCERVTHSWRTSASRWVLGMYISEQVGAGLVHQRAGGCWACTVASRWVLGLCISEQVGAGLVH